MATPNMSRKPSEAIGSAPGGGFIVRKPDGTTSITGGMSRPDAPFVSGGGGGGGNAPAPQAPPITPGVQDALAKQAQGVPLTEANIRALSNYQIRQYAQSKGINVSELNPVQQFNLAKDFNQYATQQAVKQTTPNDFNALAKTQSRQADMFVPQQSRYIPPSPQRYRPQFREAVDDLFGGGTEGGGVLNPFNIGVGAEVGLKKLGFKGVNVKVSSGGNVPQRVTTGAPSYTGPNYPNKVNLFSPEQVKTGINTGLEFGAYAVPVTGTALFGTQLATQDIPLFFNPEATPGQKLMAGANIAIGGLAFAAPRIIPKLGKSLEIAETRTRIPSKEVKLFGANPTIQRQITPTGKSVDVLTYDLSGTGRYGGMGRRVQVTEKSFVDRLLGREGTKVYEGVPYTKTGREGLKKAVDKLTDYGGISQKQARDMLRFQQPKSVDIGFKGTSATLLSGKRVTKVSGQYSYAPSNIKGARKFTRYADITKSEGVNLFEKGGIEYSRGYPEYTRIFFNKQGRPFQKLSQRGRTTDILEQMSASKPLGDITISVPKNREAVTIFDLSAKKDLGSVKSLRKVPGTLYQDVSGSRKLIPKGKKIDYGTSKIFLEGSDNALTVTRQPPFTVTRNVDIGKGISKSGKDIKFTSEQGKGLKNTLESIYGKPSKSDRLLFSNKNVEREISKSLPKAKMPKTPRLVDLEKVRVSSPSQSSFFGKGTYELTEGEISPLLRSGRGVSIRTERGQTLTPIKSNVNVIDREFTGESSRNRSNIKMFEGTVTKGDTKLGFIPVVSFKGGEDNTFRQPSRESSKTNERFIQSPRLNEQLRQVPRQRINLLTPTKTPLLPTPNRPRPRPPRMDTPLKYRDVNLFGKPKRKGELYTVEFKRRGRFFGIGKTPNLSGAIQLGRAKARETLGASFRVRKSSGGYVPLTPTNEFRSGSKGRNPFVSVQRRNVRLSSSGERREIKLSRRGGVKLV